MNPPRKPILLVEDDADIADACRELLESEGYTVQVARTGREALTYLETQSTPCLVLLDMKLPDIDGAQFLETVERSPFEAPPIVISTASHNIPKGHTVLRKPYDLSLLLNVVREHGCQAETG